MKKYHVIIISLLVILSCRSQTINDLDSLKDVIGKELFDRNLITRDQYFSKKGFSIYGLHNRKVQDILKNGVYGVSTGSHSPTFFFIYENRDITFLNISSFNGLLESTTKFLNYSVEKAYCKEITLDYLLRLIRVHYNINRNLRLRKDINCDFPAKMDRSVFTIDSFKFKFADYLFKADKLDSIDSFLDDPELIQLQKLGYYYGLPRNDQKLNIGFYTLTNLIKDQIEIFYVLISHSNFKLLELKEQGEYIQTTKEAISFGEENKLCSEDIIRIIENLWREVPGELCFKDYIKDLP